MSSESNGALVRSVRDSNDKPGLDSNQLDHSFRLIAVSMCLLLCGIVLPPGLPAMWQTVMVVIVP